jgi:hypothetical protein
MMAGSNETVESQTQAADGLLIKLEAIKTALIDLAGTKGLENGINQASKFEQKLFSATRALGLGAVQAQRMENILGKAATNVLEMGGNLEDVIGTYQSINEALEKTTFLSANVLTNIAAVNKFGVGGETVTTIAKFFDKVGGGMEAAVERTIELTQTAQKYGLNAGKFVGDVAGQMDKLNKYGFPKGVEDLASMVAKSKMLGDTLSVAQGFADQIMSDPEKAYEYAAGLQTLGGSFAQLGDGAQLLYMAQNDLNGLQDQIVKATRGIASFNEESGQFEISANERIRLRQVSKFGLDADKIEETALKLAKQEKIIKQLNFNPEFKDLKEEDKQTLANYAQLSKGGKVTIEGSEITKGTAGINEILKRIQGTGAQLTTDAEKNIDTVQANLSANERVTLTVNKLNNVYSVAILNTQKFSETLKSISDIGEKPAILAQGASTAFAGKISQKVISASSTVGNLVSSATTEAQSFMQRETGINIGAGKPIANQAQPLTVTGAVNVKIEGFDLKLSKSIVEELEGFITKKVKEGLYPGPYVGG